MVDYTYDANGNILNKSDVGASSVPFRYGPDRARYLKATTSTRTLKTYEQVETGYKVEHEHFIYADGRIVMAPVRR